MISSIRLVKYDNLLIFRGIASFLVVLNHLTPHITFGGQRLVPDWAIPFGFTSVWLFFALSSYLLASAFLNGRFDTANVRHFYVTRAKRLLPAYYVVQIVVIVMVTSGLAVEFFRVQHPLLIVAREGSILALAPWATYLSAVRSWNSPIWSVLIEIHLLLVLPFMVEELRRSHRRFLASIGIWVAVLLCVTVGSWKQVLNVYPTIYESHIYNVGFFLLGVYAAWLKHRHGALQKYRELIYAATVIAFIAVDRIAHIDLITALLFGPFLLGPAFFLLLLAIDTSYQKKMPTTYAGLLPRLSVRGLFESLGAMSYSLYLIHKFIGINIIYNLDHLVVSAHQATAFLVLVILMVIGLSAVLYIEVESRFRYRARQ